MNPTMDPIQLLSQIENIKVWQKGSQRAPHKPLLLLLALASIQRREPRLLTYEILEEKLRGLLLEYGPPRRSVHPEYPFWRLQNDGDFWEIPERAILEEERGDRLRTGDVPASILRSHGARGGFSQPVYGFLVENPEIVNELTARILNENFPASLHEDILDAIGMPWIQSVSRREARDPAFRDTIIRIYEHRCAVCGFDGKLGMTILALDAAYVKWHAAGGPDAEENGMALCALHHRLLDRGAISLTSDYRILVSQSLHGSEQVYDSVIRFSGQALRYPQKGTKRVAEEYIAWHQKEVFRSPERHIE